MSGERDMLSQTIRIDIPPDFLKTSQGKRAHPLDGAGRHKKSTPVLPKAHSPKQIDQAIADTNFQALFQRVYDGAIIADQSGKILDVNVRTVEFLRYERQELQGMTLLDIVSGADEGLLNSLRTNLEKDLFILIQAYCMRKDGTLFPAEIAVNRLIISGRDFLCFFVRDVTLRRQAEDLLRTEHNAIQNSSNGIAIATLDGRFEYVNPAVLALWKYEKIEDMLGKPISGYLEDAALASQIVSAIGAGRTWSGRTLARRRDGSTVHIQISVAGNRDADNELVSMVFSFVDISDSVRAEEAELQAERQRVMVESLGTACHHLGQPATVLLAGMELLKKHYSFAKDDNKVQELLDSGLNAAQSLRDMLHDLNAMTEYKTKPYLQTKSENRTPDEARILDF